MAAEVAIQPPQQHKQPSRKGKKAWRKNVDIDEVQHGLEEVREEETQGGVISTLPSTALFTTDTAGSETIQRIYSKRHKPLKADEILARRSAVPALESRKRAASPPRKRSRTNDFVPHRELERLRDVAYGGARAKEPEAEEGAGQGATYDPWADDATAQTDVTAKNNFLEPKRPVRAPGTLKQAPAPLTANGVAPPAVRKPHPGRSYNPTFLDWDRVYTREGEKEVEAERQRRNVAREQQEREERAQEVAEEVEQMEREREEWSEWESEWEGIRSEVDDEDESGVVKKTREEKRKTKADRNRIRKRKEGERALAEEKARKAKEAQAARVKAIAKEVDSKSRGITKEVVVAPDDSSADEAEEEALKPTRFGKIPVPNAPLEVVLPEELQESLRLLKPEGNLLTDRYRSMVIGGKIEPRRPVGQVKKPRRTYTEKWSYKDWTLPPASR